MIYIDTSVALSQLLDEDRKPRVSLWDHPLVASRLLEFELWTRLHAYDPDGTRTDAARTLLARLAMLDVIPETVGRVYEPWPVPLRTLDALHLASLEFLRGEGVDISLASYDERLLAAARKLKVKIFRI